MLDRRYAGVENAYRTLVMDSGAKVQMVGADFQQMDYVSSVKSLEARIASAGGVPPIIVGLKAGLDASTYSNYALAMRAFADHTIRPQWNSVVAALGQIVDRPPGGELWYDDRHVAALRQDKQVESQIQETWARTIRTYVDGGFTPDSAVLATVNGDPTLLEHTGLYSVQLQPAGSDNDEPSSMGAAAADLEVPV
jgi:phage portal protein BeeE